MSYLYSYVWSDKYDHANEMYGISYFKRYRISEFFAGRFIVARDYKSAIFILRNRRTASSAFRRHDADSTTHRSK